MRQSLQDEIKFAKQEIDVQNLEMLRPSIEEEMNRDWRRPEDRDCEAVTSGPDQVRKQGECHPEFSDFEALN